MATNLINNRPGQVVIEQSKLLDQYRAAETLDDLGAGILPSFPVLSILGGKFWIKFHGETVLVADDRGYARPDIDVVIVYAPRHKSKTYFPDGFDQKNPNVPPTCWSSDGKVPDAAVPPDQLQNDVCATCQWDKIGSAIIAGSDKKTKACGDHKRVVVVPAGDILNESFGGLMLLRVPASSLKNLQAYGDYLKSNKALYFGQVTTLTFDATPGISYPKLNFERTRALTDDEVELILEARESDQVKRILNEEISVTDPTTAESSIDVDDGVAPTPQSNPQPQVVQSQPVQPVQPTMRVVPQATPQPVRSPVQPQQPQPATRVAPAPVKPAQTPPQPRQPTAQPTARPVGAAFGAKPAQATAQPRPTTAQGTINSAMTKPSAAPASTRTVVQPAPVENDTPAGMDTEEGGGAIPDELDETFGKVMGTT